MNFLFFGKIILKKDSQKKIKIDIAKESILFECVLSTFIHEFYFFKIFCLAWKIVKNIGTNQSWYLNENVLKIYEGYLPKIMDFPEVDIKNSKL